MMFAIIPLRYLSTRKNKKNQRKTIDLGMEMEEEREKQRDDGDSRWWIRNKDEFDDR